MLDRPFPSSSLGACWDGLAGQTTRIIALCTFPPYPVLSLPDTKVCEVLKMQTLLLYFCVGIIHSSICEQLAITCQSVSALSNSQIEITDPLLTNKVL